MVDFDDGLVSIRAAVHTATLSVWERDTVSPRQRMKRIASWKALYARWPTVSFAISAG